MSNIREDILSLSNLEEGFSFKSKKKREEELASASKAEAKKVALRKVYRLAVIFTRENKTKEAQNFPRLCDENWKKVEKEAIQLARDIKKGKSHYQYDTELPLKELVAPLTEKEVLDEIENTFFRTSFTR